MIFTILYCAIFLSWYTHYIMFSHWVCAKPKDLKQLYFTVTLTTLLTITEWSISHKDINYQYLILTPHISFPMNFGGDELVLILYITIEKRPVLMCINYNIYLYTYIKFVHEEFIFIQYNIYI